MTRRMEVRRRRGLEQQRAYHVSHRFAARVCQVGRGGAVPSECQCQAVESLETRVLITRAVSSLDFSTSPYGRPGFGDRLLGFVSVSAAL